MNYRCVECVEDDDCAADTTCDITDNEHGGDCKVPLGGDCDNADDCASDLTCGEGLCVVPAPLGGDCDNSRDCASGLSCHWSVCRMQFYGSCSTNTDCASGLACASNGRCLHQNGGSCFWDGFCASGRCRIRWRGWQMNYVCVE